MDNCKGCAVEDECGIPYHYDEELLSECPCSICLIKSMCDIGICDDYRKFINKVREDWKT